MNSLTLRLCQYLRRRLRTPRRRGGYWLRHGRGPAKPRDTPARQATMINARRNQVGTGSSMGGISTGSMRIPPEQVFFKEARETARSYLPVRRWTIRCLRSRSDPHDDLRRRMAFGCSRRSNQRSCDGMSQEFIGLANSVLDLVNAVGFDVAVYRSCAQDDWCEIGAWHPNGRFIRVESDDLYSAACEVAHLAGVDLIDG